MYGTLCYTSDMEEKKRKRRPLVHISQSTHDRLKRYRKMNPMRPSMYAIADLAITAYLDNKELNE